MIMDEAGMKRMQDEKTAETAIAECLPHSAHITSDSSEMDVGNLKFPFHD